MSEDDPIASAIYTHYSSAFAALSVDDGICLGSAFRILHEASSALADLDLLAPAVRVRGWRTAIGLDRVNDGGYDLKFEVWLAIGPVGQLARLVDECEFLWSPDQSSSVEPDLPDYAVLPDPRCLFTEGRIEAEWMGFLRRLRDRYRALDAELQTLTSDSSEAACLVFHGYLLAMALHQVLVMLEFAETIST
jgi:hypothetical protein